MVERQPSKLNVAGSNPVSRSKKFQLMKYLLKFLLFFFVCNLSFSQSDYRTWIIGKVLYRDSNVISANVINNTSQEATITNQDGEFEIKVKFVNQNNWLFLELSHLRTFACEFKHLSPDF